MNIKKTNFKLAALAILTAGAALSACNDIEPGDRYKELPPIDAKRGVLLEEFTGQKCVNCPEAHDIIKGLKQQYGDQLIVVGIHSGGDAFSIGDGDAVWGGITQCLRVPDGEEYAKKAGVVSGVGLPIGAINRTSGLVGRNAWSDIIRNEIQKEPIVDIDLQPELVNDASGEPTKLKITADLKISTDKVSCNLQLWILESDITALQYGLNNSFNFDYKHDHVFRAAVNGFNGEAVSIVHGTPTTIEHELELNPKWNAENLSVVGFVYNGSGVLQAVEAKVSSGSDEPEE